MLLCCLLNFYKFVFLFYAFFAISKSITWRSLVATFTYHTRNKATMKLVPRKGKLMSWEIRDEIFRDIVRYSWEISEKIKWKLSISHPPSTYASKKWDFFFFWLLTLHFRSPECTPLHPQRYRQRQNQKKDPGTKHWWRIDVDDDISRALVP